MVGSSGGGTSAEEVNLLNPAAGTYTVLVDGFADGESLHLHPVHLGAGLDGSRQHDGGRSGDGHARRGRVTINLTFSGLTAGTKYLGSVVYGGAAGMPNPTIVRVDAP